MTEAVQETARAEWALLEVMGHRSHWGVLTEVERFGAKMARIDVFAADDTEPRATHFYGGPSIFSITPATEGVCRERSTPWEPRQALLSHDLQEPEPSDLEEDL